MQIYTYESKQCGFQLSIPDSWSGSLSLDLVGTLPDVDKNAWDSLGGVTDSKTVIGPGGKYLNVLITPLAENEPEPTIEQTEEYFDGLTYRQNLHVIATGTVNIANKEHFWATYYRMTLFGQRQLQFLKKYCLFLNRTEYLITAGLWSAFPGESPPTSQTLKDSEQVYDEIVSSFALLND